MIYWLTGQPGAGKTTLGNMLMTYLPNAIQIDGDDLRKLTKNLDYSENGRRQNIEEAQNLAIVAHQNGFNVIVSLVSPYKDQRDMFKKMYHVYEIFVHTTEDRGRNKWHVENYEQPTEDFIDIDTTNKTIEESYKELIEKLCL